MNQIEQNKIISMIKSLDNELSTLGIKLLLSNDAWEVEAFFYRHGSKFNMSDPLTLTYPYLRSNARRASLYTHTELCIRVVNSELTVFRNMLGELFLLTPHEVSVYIKKHPKYTEL